MQSCTKDNNQKQTDYQVKEYFPKEGESVRQKVYDFLVAANRINQNHKSAAATIQDTEPNEAVWLMEAASNAEKYGELDKPSAERKTFTIELDNIQAADGSVKASSASIASKYTAMMNTINAEETSTKKGQLIDLKTIDFNNLKTVIKVDVLYSQADLSDIVLFEDEPTDANPLNCNYNPALTVPVLNYDLGVDDNIWNQTFGNFTMDYPSGISSVAGCNNTTFSSNQLGNYAWYFNTIADQEIYYNPPVVVGNNGSLDLSFQNPEYVPFSNVQFVYSQDLIDDLGCATLLNNSSLWQGSNSIFSYALNLYADMIYTYETILPSSQYIEYRPVHGHIRGGQDSYGCFLRVSSLGYIHVNNN